MAITDWPTSERPREKLLARGAQSLSDAELLAIFLRTGIKGKTAVDMARELLSHFGSLNALLSARQDHFCQYPGLGVAKFTQLQAVLEMSRRHLYEELTHNSAVLTSPQQSIRFLQSRLGRQPKEVFAVLFLDNQHQVIRFEELFQGTINAASVYPREVVRRVIELNAAAVILAHNHPSGVTEPSMADRQITEVLTKALALIDVKVLDHIVLGGVNHTSFAERGWL